MSYQQEDGTAGYKKCDIIGEVHTFRAELDANAAKCETSAVDDLEVISL